MENESLREAVENGDVERVHEVLAQGADPNFVDGDGTPPLHLAAAAGNAELAGVLLASGAVVDLPEPIDGATALHVAARRGHHDTVQTLLVYGANVTCATTSGVTPLHLAAQAGHSRVIELLLASGADPEQTEAQGERTALHFAASEGHHDAARLLIWSGADPNRVDGFGLTALTLSCANGHTEAVQTLLMQGANVNAADQAGETPLMSAIINGQNAVASILLDQGANVDAQDNSGMTPLHLAATQGNDALIEPLLRRGATLSITDSNGATAAEAAEASGQSHIAELLHNEESRVAEPTPVLAPPNKPQVFRLTPESGAAAKPQTAAAPQPRFESPDITEIQPVAERAPEPKPEPPAPVRRRRRRKYTLKPGAVVALFVIGTASAVAYVSQIRPEIGAQILQRLKLSEPPKPPAPRLPPPIPKLKGPINDFADILDPTRKSEIAAIIEEARKKAGAEIAVVTVDTTQPTKLTEFAGKLAAEWTAGRSGPAALLVIAMDRSEVSIQTSPKAQALLSAKRAEELIQQEIRPLLEIGDYRTGIVSGTRAIKRILSKEPDFKDGRTGTETTGQTARASTERRSSQSLSPRSEGGYSARILSSPEGAIAIIDRGTYVGQTPLAIELPYGRHVVEVRLPGYVSQRERIWVSQNNMSYSFNLVPVLD